MVHSRTEAVTDNSVSFQFVKINILSVLSGELHDLETVMLQELWLCAELF